MSNRRNSDRTTLAVVACPDGSSKGCDDDDLLSACAGCEVWVDFEITGVLFPVVPIFFSCFVIVDHNPIANDLPRRQDITLYDIFLGIWNSLQEVFCRGKSEENTVRKGLLDLVNVASLNDHDAASAILLSFPALCTV